MFLNVKYVRPVEICNVYGEDAVSEGMVRRIIFDIELYRIEQSGNKSIRRSDELP